MSKQFYKALNQFEIWPDITNCNSASLSFADVMLLQQLSSINSRSEVDLSCSLGSYRLKVPIITAPMDTVSGEKMIRAMHKLGAIGTLPRDTIENNIKMCKKLTADKVRCIYTVGLTNAVADAKKLQKAGAKVILLDIANGAMNKVINAAKKMKKELKLTVIVGNVTTFELVNKYKEAGIDIARVGVGSGGACTTRRVAGTGFPQLSAIMETSSAGIPVIADGGVKEPGDVAKALAAGASYVMIGSMFAGTEETPGEIIDGKKIFYGQASDRYMHKNGVSVTAKRAPEGLVTTVVYKGPVEKIVNYITGGLASALSYAGAKNLDEFREKSAFVLVSAAARATGGRMEK